jgi:hypothetical protein
LTRHQYGLQPALAEQPDFDDARIGSGDCATPHEFLDANIWLRLHYDAKFSNAVGPTGTHLSRPRPMTDRRMPEYLRVLRM